MVIATVLYAAMQTIITLLFSGALWISQKILDSSITVFSEGDNIIQNFINLLPFPETLNISGIIFGIADALLIFIFAVFGEITKEKLDVLDTVNKLSLKNEFIATNALKDVYECLPKRTYQMISKGIYNLSKNLNVSNNQELFSIRD